MPLVYVIGLKALIREIEERATGEGVAARARDHVELTPPVSVSAEAALWLIWTSS